MVIIALLEKVASHAYLTHVYFAIKRAFMVRLSKPKHPLLIMPVMCINVVTLCPSGVPLLGHVLPYKIFHKHFRAVFPSLTCFPLIKKDKAGLGVRGGGLVERRFSTRTVDQ